MKICNSLRLNNKVYTHTYTVYGTFVGLNLPLYIIPFEAPIYLVRYTHTVTMSSLCRPNLLYSYSIVPQRCRPSIFQKQSRPTSSWCMQGWRTANCWRKWRVSPVHSFKTYCSSLTLLFIHTLKLLLCHTTYVVGHLYTAHTYIHSHLLQLLSFAALHGCGVCIKGVQNVVVQVKIDTAST